MVWSNQGVAKKGNLYKATWPETVGDILFEATCCGGDVIFGFFYTCSKLFILFSSGNVFFSFFVEQKPPHLVYFLLNFLFSEFSCYYEPKMITLD